MVKLRGEEIWAAAGLEAALVGTEVRQHDDNSGQSMYDLDILRNGAVIGACEVTAAADRHLIELWNLVNGRDARHIEPGLRGGWTLALRPTCRKNTLMSGLRPFVEDLEARQISQAGQYWTPSDIEEVMDSLGIDHVFQGGTDFPGSIYFTIDLPPEMNGGMVPDTGDPLCEWLEAWIADPARERKITKLLNSVAPEKHLFVILPGFSQAPFVAADVLMRDHGPLPTRSPRVPNGITHLWVMSTWSSGDLFAWSASNGWTRHEKTTTIPARLAA
jgi:hypothetical protein